MVEIIISLVTGVLGGGGVGGALKNLSMGKMGNLVSGGLGCSHSDHWHGEK